MPTDLPGGEIGDLPVERRRDDVMRHILRVGSDLFYRKGIRAVGIEEIIREADVAKATLYRHFPSKEALVIAYLENRSTFALDRLRRSGDGIDQPRARILGAFAALDSNLANPEFRGCAFLMATSEHGETAAVREVSVRHKLAVLAYFNTLATQAGITDAALPRRLALVYEGALATAAIRPDADAGRTALDMADLLLAGAAARQETQPR